MGVGPHQDDSEPSRPSVRRPQPREPYGEGSDARELAVPVGGRPPGAEAELHDVQLPALECQRDHRPDAMAHVVGLSASRARAA